MRAILQEDLDDARVSVERCEMEGCGALTRIISNTILL